MSTEKIDRVYEEEVVKSNTIYAQIMDLIKEYNKLGISTQISGVTHSGKPKIAL